MVEPDCCDKACREKYWDEQTPEQRLESLRDVILSMRLSMRCHLSQMENELSALMHHQHSVSGELMTRIEQLSMASSSGNWVPTSLQTTPVNPEKIGLVKKGY